MASVWWMALALVLGLAACGDEAPTAQDPAAEDGLDDGATDEDDNNDDDEDDDSDGPSKEEDDAGVDAGEDGGSDDGDEDANGVEAGDAGEDSAEPEGCEAGWAEVFEEPTELVKDVEGVGTFPRCASAQRFMVLPSEMAVSVTVGELPAGSAVQVESMTGEVGAQGYATEGSLTLDFVVPSSGEWRLKVQRPDGEDESQWSAQWSCMEGCDRETTRYPIVLLHGLAGTDQYFGILDYFYQVPDALREKGYRVYTPVSSFIGHSEVRAPQIAEQVDEVLQETGAEKVHLLGHSQGGLDMRVLVSGLGYGDRVASMTSLATPHQGLKIEVPAFFTGMDFGETYMKGEFVETYPDDEGVPRFSWAGRTCAIYELQCLAETDNEVVTPIFALTYPAIQYAHRDDPYGGANDGLVPIESSKWGEFLGVVPADHMDEVGQIAGVGGFDQVAFFLSEARRMRGVE